MSKMLEEFKQGNLGIVVSKDMEIVERLKNYLMPLKWRSGDSINSKLIDTYLEDKESIVLMCDSAVWYRKISQYETDFYQPFLVTAIEFLNDQCLEIDDEDLMLLIGE